MMDFDPEKVERFELGKYEFWQGETEFAVSASDFDSLLSAYRETMRALEMAGSDSSGSGIDAWLSEARSELSREAIQPTKGGV